MGRLVAMHTLVLSTHTMDVLYGLYCLLIELFRVWMAKICTAISRVRYPCFILVPSHVGDRSQTIEDTKPSCQVLAEASTIGDLLEPSEPSGISTADALIREYVNDIIDKSLVTVKSTANSNATVDGDQGKPSDADLGDVLDYLVIVKDITKIDGHHDRDLDRPAVTDISDDIRGYVNGIIGKSLTIVKETARRDSQELKDLSTPFHSDVRDYVNGIIDKGLAIVKSGAIETCQGTAPSHCVADDTITQFLANSSGKKEPNVRGHTTSVTSFRALDVDVTATIWKGRVWSKYSKARCPSRDLWLRSQSVPRDFAPKRFKMLPTKCKKHHPSDRSEIAVKSAEHTSVFRKQTMAPDPMTTEDGIGTGIQQTAANAHPRRENKKRGLKKIRKWFAKYLCCIPVGEFD